MEAIYDSFTFVVSRQPMGKPPDYDLAVFVILGAFFYTFLMPMLDSILAMLRSGLECLGVSDISSCILFCLLMRSYIGLDVFYSGVIAIRFTCFTYVTIVSMLQLLIHYVEWPISCFATNRNEATSRNTKRPEWAMFMNFTRHGFRRHLMRQAPPAVQHSALTTRSNINSNIATSGELFGTVVSAPSGLNQTRIPFNEQRARGLQTVLMLVMGSSHYACVQVFQGCAQCPETLIAGQLSRPRVQHGQSSNGHQNSAKRSHGERGESDDGEEENSPCRKRSRAERPPAVSTKKLACPFYRNDPESNRKHRSCAGPGWASIHRVKEHILRQHALPIHCPRCLMTFNTDKDCKLHLRQATLCPLSDADPPEGYDKEQEAALRVRRRGNAEREWVAIYKLLFPGVPEEFIPSPYYDDDEMQLELLQRRESNRFQRHMELAVPRSVVRLLERTTFEPPISLNIPVRTQLVEIVASAVAEASQSYRQRESPPTEAQAPAVLNEPFSFTQHPQIPGAPDSMLYLPTSTLTHEPFQPQTNVRQHGGLEYGLDHSTSVQDGIEHQGNDPRPGNELLVDPLTLDMSLFGWNPGQDTLFQGP